MKVCIVCSQQFKSLGWACPACGNTPKQMEGYFTFAPELAEENAGFETKFFAQLAPLEEKNFWFRSRNRLIIWALQHYFPYAKNFLEVGCGTGFVLSGLDEAFPKLTLYGSEIFTTGLSFAKQRISRVELFQMDARKIPFENEFDVIGAFDVLEHIKEDITVLCQMYKAVRESGGIMLTVPQHPWLWSQVDENSHHVRRYCTQELKTKVECAGFKVIKITSFVSLLLPLMILSRWQQRGSNLGDKATSELTVSGWMNAALENILNLERTIIRSGISLPAGGSLLLIAKKL